MASGICDSRIADARAAVRALARGLALPSGAMSRGSRVRRRSRPTLEERRRQVEEALRPAAAPGARPRCEAALRGQPLRARQAPAARSLSLMVAEVLPRRSAARAARGLRGRDGAHGEPDPRRPALDGRRALAARPARLPRRPRRGHRHPGRLRAPEPRLRDPGRGLAGGPDAARARARSPATWRARSASTA